MLTQDPQVGFNPLASLGAVLLQKELEEVAGEREVTYIDATRILSDEDPSV